jgi:hypothetical protein
MHSSERLYCVAESSPLQAIDLVDEAASRLRLDLDQQPAVGEKEGRCSWLSCLQEAACWL